MAGSMKEEPLYTLSGEVIGGRGLGKLVGAPTVNLQIASRDALPPSGVYVTEAVLEKQAYYGVSNIGTRPAPEGGLFLEAFLFDFRREIEGQAMEIRLYKKLRDRRRFDSLSLLLEQIQEDCIAAQLFWGMAPAVSRLHMDIEKHTASVNGLQLRLTRKEFDLLYLLYSNPDTAFRKEQIYETVWHELSGGHCHAVENTVFQIRRKCRAHTGGRDFIRTVAGYGYQFNAI